MRNKLSRALIALVALFSLWAAIGSADPNSTAAPADTADNSSEADAFAEDADADAEQESAPVEESVPEQEQFGLDFDEASTNAEEMTDLQFDTWAADFVGTEIGWHGQVERVDQDLFDDTIFRVIVDPRGGESLERANLLVSRELALAIPQDQEVFFTGSIQEMTNVIGLAVDVTDVEIQDRAGNVFEAVATDAPADTAAAGDPSSFDTFSAQADQLTDAQFDAWVQPLIGTEFSWTGQVESVDENLFEPGTFEIVVDVEGGESFGERARLQVTEAEALTVNQDATIAFTGTLSEADTTIVLQLEFTNVSFTTS